MWDNYIFKLLTLVILFTATECVESPKSWFTNAGHFNLVTHSVKVPISIAIEDFDSYISDVKTELILFQKTLRTFLRNNTITDSRIKAYEQALSPILNNVIIHLGTELYTLDFISKELRNSILTPRGGQRTEQQNGNTRPRHARNRRALLTFLNPLLTQIFGYATSTEIEDLASNMNILRSQMHTVSSFMGDSIQYLNHTTLEINLNRALIRNICNNVQESREYFTEALSNLTVTVDDGFELNHFTNKLHTLISIVSSTFRRVGHSLHILRNDLNLALSGRLSSTLVPARQLRALLLKIKREIPESYTLPYRLGKSTLSEYYRNLPIIATANQHVIFVVMVIPLKSLALSFDRYQAFQIPAAYNGKLHYWKTESKYLAVSRDRLTYMTLDESEFEACQGDFCNIQKPIYMVRNADECLLALYQNDEVYATELCEVYTRKFPMRPKAENIYRNKWIILTRRPMTINVICNRDMGNAMTNSTELEINSATYVITLQKNCEVESEFFHILPSSSETERIENSVWAGMVEVKFPQWNYSEIARERDDRKELQVSNELEEIKEVNDVGTNDVMGSYDMSDEGWNENIVHHSTSMYLVITVLIILLGIVVVIVVLCCIRYRSKLYKYDPTGDKKTPRLVGIKLREIPSKIIVEEVEVGIAPLAKEEKTEENGSICSDCG